MAAAPSTMSSTIPEKSSAPARAMTNTNVTKRLQTELMSLMMNPTPGITAFPSATSLQTWTATIIGPAETPYADLTLKLKFEFSAEYPYSAPTVTFRTPIFHPNIDFSGRICLDILKDKWSSVLDVRSVLVSLQSLLGEPNTSSPLNGQAAELWDSDREEFKRLVLARHQDVEDEGMEDAEMMG